jgi:O-antigen/teichoic acid export membrane protein
MYVKTLQFIKKKFAFLTAFGIVKIVAYLTPIWLADILSNHDYSTVEYALAGLGILVSAGFGLGIPGAYPYFILKKQETDKEAAFSIHPLWLLLLFIINQILFYGFGIYNMKIYLALNFSFVLANQQFYSTKLKSKESILKAILIDSGVYFLLFVFIIGVITKLIKPSLYYINNLILVYALVYIIYGLFQYYKVKKDDIINTYKQILKYSVHILLSSILIFAITVSGRILADEFFGNDAVGVYGFYYRLAAMVVLIHQVVSIMFFKKIYTFNPKILDRYFALFFVGIYAVSLVIYILAPFILPSFSDYFNETYLDNKLLFFILSSQMIMWIASALNSSIVDREGLAKKNNPRFLVLIIIGLAILYAIKDQLTLDLLAYIHFTVFYLATLIQYYSLYKKGIVFKKSFLVLTTTYIISTVCLFFIL